MHQIFREALPGSSERSVSIQGHEDKICDVIDYVLEQLSGTKVHGCAGSTTHTHTHTHTHTCTHLSNKFVHLQCLKKL